jgi:arsenate reductase-like glutaredoxin family protein
VVDAHSACAVMQNHASTVKRPVVVWSDASVTVGFDTTIWTARLP